MPNLHSAVCLAACVALIILVIVWSSTLWSPNHPDIAIIGAGPVGLLMALELCDRGARKITVYGEYTPSMLDIGLVQYGTNPNYATGIPLRFGHKITSNQPTFDDINSTQPPQLHISDIDTPKLTTVKHMFHKSLTEWALANNISLDVLGTKQMLMYEATGNGSLTTSPLHHSATGLVLGLSGKPTMHLANIPEVMLSVVNYLKTKGVKFTPGVVDSVGLANSSKKKWGVTLQGKSKLEPHHHDHVVIATCDPSTVISPALDIISPNITKDKYFSTVHRVQGRVPATHVFSEVITTDTHNKAMVSVAQHTPGDTHRTVTSYGRRSTDDMSVISSNVKQQLGGILPNTGSIETVAATPITGCAQYTTTAVSNRIPMHMASLQGHDNLWFTGSLFSHSDLSNIMQFNKLIANKLIAKSMHRPTTKPTNLISSPAT